MGPKSDGSKFSLWFKNDWSWIGEASKPRITVLREGDDVLVLKAEHRVPSAYSLHCEPPKEALFTENESNAMRLWNWPNPSPYVKDAFHEYVVGVRTEAVNPARVGSKAAAHYVFSVDAGETSRRSRSRTASRSTMR